MPRSRCHHAYKKRPKIIIGKLKAIKVGCCVEGYFGKLFNSSNKKASHTSTFTINSRRYKGMGIVTMSLGDNRWQVKADCDG